MQSIMPMELRNRRQWHVWQNEDGSKIPIQVNGQNAKSNDPETWTDYDTADAVKDRFSGLAFVLTQEDGLCGIDLDNCLDSNGMLLSWAAQILMRFDGISFAEISPGGRGIKLITRATKSADARCVHVIDGNEKWQIECYDNRRFWTITGRSYAGMNTIGDGQHAVDWLCDTFLTPLTTPLKKKTSVVSLPVYESTLEQRARQYVQAVPHVAQGERNTTVFKLSGHLQSLDDLGTRLTEDQILSFCLDWNAGLAEPLPSEEVEKAVKSGIINGTPREIKITTSSIPSIKHTDVDLSLLLQQGKTTSTSGEIPIELIRSAPGMIGSIYQWIEDTSLYVLPEIFLASALAVMSLITGRKVRDHLGNRTNLYVLAMAPTASGKEHPRQKVKELLLTVGGESLTGPEDLASAAGLGARLVDHPATLFQFDEFGFFLAQVSSRFAPIHLQQIESDLLKLYTSAGTTWTGRSYADQDKVPRIVQPHCVISGSATPDTLWDAISQRQIHAGLLGRIQVFEAITCVPLRDVLPKDRDALPIEIVNAVRWWLDYTPPGDGNLLSEHPQPTVMSQTAPAAKLLESHMRDIGQRRVNEEAVRGSIWGRSAEKAYKLSMLAACAERQFEVQLHHAEWAIALQNAITRKMLLRIQANLSESRAEATKKMVLRKIGSERISMSQLTRKTQFLKNKRERNEIIEELLESGQITIETEGSGTSKTVFIKSFL